MEIVRKYYKSEPFDGNDYFLNTSGAHVLTLKVTLSDGRSVLNKLFYFPADGLNAVEQALNDAKKFIASEGVELYDKKAS